jgi:hypothetical protein
MNEAVRTNNPIHDRKIDGIYKVLGENWVDGGLCENLPWPYIVSAGEGFRHMWLWDTAFGVAGWAPMADPRTKLTYRNHWHWMDHSPNFPEGSPGYGLIPGVIVTDFGPDFLTFKYSQYPLEAWGIAMVYRQDGDKAFVEESLPYLRKYHRWYASERDIDGDLLIEAGSYTGETQHARMEGFDFKPSLDLMRMTNRQGQLSGNRWYGDAELVEMTSFVIGMEKILGEFEELLGDAAAAQHYRDLAVRREAALNQRMWNEEDGFYYDIHRDTHQPIRVKTVFGFMPLFSGSCSKQQAARLVAHLKNPEEFWTPCPVPTEARNEPTFRPPDYGRCDTCIETNYLVAAGLCNYGYYDLARELTDLSFQMVDEKTCRENYNSVTGEAGGARFVTFNACLPLMIWQNYYGIGEDFRTIRVTDQDWGKQLKVGKLEVEYTSKQEIRLRSEFGREFRVVAPDSWRGRTVQVARSGEGKPAMQEVRGEPVTFTAEPGAWYTVQRM